MIGDDQAFQVLKAELAQADAEQLGVDGLLDIPAHHGQLEAVDAAQEVVQLPAELADLGIREVGGLELGMRRARVADPLEADRELDVPVPGEPSDARAEQADRQVPDVDVARNEHCRPGCVHRLAHRRHLVGS